MINKSKHKLFNLIFLIIIIAITIVVAIPNNIYADEEEEDDDGIIFQSATPSQADIDLAEKGKDKNLQQDDQNSVLLFKTINTSNFTKEFKYNVAQWYYILRYLSIAAMLVILVVLGIKLAITSIAEQKALYKRMLLDWVVGFVLIFTIHYFMIFIQYLNETLIGIIREVNINMNTGGEYGLYETVRSRAYDLKFSVGTAGMIMYMTLVYFTIRYIWMYTKRFITIVLLTIMAPIVVVIYAVKKVLSGKTNILTTWMEEYAFNILLQTVHALMYAIFVGMALKLAETSLVGIILAFVILNMMTKCEDIFRKIFKFSDKSSLAEETAKSDLAKDIKDLRQTAVGAGAVATLATKPVVGLGKRVLPQAVKPAIKAGQLLKEHPQRKLDKLNKEKEKLEGNKKPSKEQQEKINKLDKQIDSMKNKMEAKENKKEQKRKAKEGRPYSFVRETCSRFKDIFDVDNYLETVKDKDGNEKKRIVRKEKYVDKYGRKVSYGGVGSRFKQATHNVFALSAADKKVINNMFQFAKSGVLGVGGMMVGLGSIVASPKVGMALLANGVSNYKEFAGRKKSDLKISRKMKRKIKKLSRQKNKEYKFSKFSTKSKMSIDEILRQLARTDPSVEHIEHLRSCLNSGRLLPSIAMLPFTLTGMKGVADNLLLQAKAVAKQNKKNLMHYERGVDVELAESLSDDVIEFHEKMKANIHSEVYSEDYNLSEGITKVKLDSGINFVIDNKMFTFSGAENEISGMNDFLREALIRTGMNLNIYDLSKLDLNNKTVVNELMIQLKALGIYDDNLISDPRNIRELLYSKNGINDLKNSYEQNNPDLLKNRVYQKIVGQYMQEKGIQSINDVDAQEIMIRYLNKALDNRDNTFLSSEIVDFALKSNGGNLSELNINELTNSLLVNGADSDVLKNNIQSQLKILMKNVSEIVMSALISNGNKSLEDLDLSADENKDLLMELVNSLKLLGLNNSDEELMNLAQSKINSISDEEFYEAIAREELNKFIEENYAGDPNAFYNDSEGEKNFNEYIDEYFSNYFASENENSDGVIEELKNKSKSKSNDEDEDSRTTNLPLPEVKTTVGSDGVLSCYYSIPIGDGNPDDIYIEVSKIEISNNTESYTSWIRGEKVDIKEGEVAIGRLVKDGKNGPELFIRYPSSGKRIRNSSEDEDISLRLEKEILENRLRATSSEEEEIKLQDKINEAKAKNPESRVEELLRQREEVSRINETNDIMKNLYTSKDSDDEVIKELMNNSAREMIGLGVEKKVANNIVDLMIQEKYLDEDIKSLKMNESPNQYARIKRSKANQSKKIGTTQISDNFGEFIKELGKGV